MAFPLGVVDYNVSLDGGRTWSGGRLRNRIGGEDPPFPTPAGEQNFDAGGLHFNTGIVFGPTRTSITFSVHRGEPNRVDTSPPLERGAGDDVMVARSTDPATALHRFASSATPKIRPAHRPHTLHTHRC